MSVREGHGPKVRGASENSPKISLVVPEEKYNITELFPDTNMFYDFKKLRCEVMR